MKKGLQQQREKKGPREARGKNQELRQQRDNIDEDDEEAEEEEEEEEEEAEKEQGEEEADDSTTIAFHHSSRTQTTTLKSRPLTFLWTASNSKRIRRRPQRGGSQ